MMKNKVIALTMVMATVLLSGCGKEISVIGNQSESVEENNITTEQEEVGNIDEDMEEVVSNEVLTNLDAVSDTDETNLNLKEYRYSFEDRDIADGGEAVFYLADFEDDSNYFHITDSIQIYAFNGSCIGHTKADIDITTIGRYDEWYYLMLDKNHRFVKVADVEAVISDISQNEDVVATNQTTTSTQNNTTTTIPSSNVTENVSNASAEAPVEAPTETPPQTSDKYTPEEAVAVWSGILNDNGMTFDPSIKEYASWGTGIIYLNRGMPEQIAQQDLLGYAYGDGGGHSFYRYYYEVTDSDDSAVYITAWCCP